MISSQGGVRCLPSLVDLPGLTGIKQVASSIQGHCALTLQNTIKCWTDAAPMPVDFPGLSGIKQIVAGGKFYCVVTAQDSVQCWGDNYFGNLGDATTTNSDTPVAVSGLSGVKSLYSGAYAICAILAADGGVKCWGYEYPLNSTTSASIPISIPGLMGATQISIGSDHSCALTSAGQVKCWSSGPVAPTDAGLANIKQITAGTQFTCAITAQDGVKCWGPRSYSIFGLTGLAPSAVIDTPLVGVKQIVASVPGPGQVDRMFVSYLNDRVGVVGDISTSSFTPVDVTIAAP